MITRWAGDLPGGRRVSVYAENRVLATRLLKAGGYPWRDIVWEREKLEDVPRMLVEAEGGRRSAVAGAK